MLNITQRRRKTINRHGKATKHINTMTANEKQKLFIEVATSNAERFLNQVRSEAENYAHNPSNSSQFTNFNKEGVRHLGVDFFRLMLGMRSQEMNLTYLKERAEKE